MDTATQTDPRNPYVVDDLGVQENRGKAFEGDGTRYDTVLLAGAGAAITSPIKFFRNRYGKANVDGFTTKSIVHTNMVADRNFGKHCHPTITRIMVAIAQVGTNVGTPNLARVMRTLWEDGLFKLKVSNNLEMREHLIRFHGPGLTGLLGGHGGQPKIAVAPAPTLHGAHRLADPISLDERQSFECEITLNSNESGGGFTLAAGEDLAIKVILQGNFTRRINA